MNRTDPAFFRQALDNLPTAVLIADDTANYIEANAAACALLDRSRADIIGHHLSEIVSPDRVAEVDVQWRAFLRDGAQSGLFAIRLKNGATRQVHFTARANFIPGYHCSVLTEQHQAAEPAAYADLTVCPWSKRVRHRGEWIAIEEYLEKVHGLTVRHAASPGATASLR